MICLTSAIYRRAKVIIFHYLHHLYLLLFMLYTTPCLSSFSFYVSIIR